MNSKFGILFAITFVLFHISTAADQITIDNLVLSFSEAGPQLGQVCVQIYQDDPNGWSDNYLCMNRDYGVSYVKISESDGWPAGIGKCTNLYDPEDSVALVWLHNYLCVPPNNPWWFVFSPSTAIPGLDCIAMVQPEDSAWYDNYLCVNGTYEVPALVTDSTTTTQVNTPVEVVTPPVDYFAASGQPIVLEVDTPMIPDAMAIDQAGMKVEPDTPFVTVSTTTGQLGVPKVDTPLIIDAMAIGQLSAQGEIKTPLISQSMINGQLSAEKRKGSQSLEKGPTQLKNRKKL